MRVESGIVAIDECAAEFVFGELAGAVFVYLHEERPETIAIVLVAGSRADGGRTLLLGNWWAVMRAAWWRTLAIVCRRRW